MRKVPRLAVVLAVGATVVAMVGVAGGTDPAEEVSAPAWSGPVWMDASKAPYKGYVRGWALISAQELKHQMDLERAWQTRIPLSDGTMPATDPKLVVIDVGHPATQYRVDGHIPGAINIWRPDYESTEKHWDVRGEDLMNRKDFERFLRSLGIHNDSMVVWYDHKYDATRLWWACKLYGFDTRVLDGGIKAWKDAGYEIDRIASASRPGNGTIVLAEWGHPYLKVGRDSVWKCKDNPRWVLWDIRSKAEWDGSRKRVRRPGHIPWQKGAWYSWKDVHRPDNTFLDSAELEAYTDRIGMQPTDHNVFYCQSGVRVTQPLFALFLQGWPLEHLHIFDSSFIGWANSPDLPVVDGEGKPVVSEDAREVEIKD